MYQFDVLNIVDQSGVYLFYSSDKLLLQVLMWNMNLKYPKNHNRHLSDFNIHPYDYLILLDQRNFLLLDMMMP